MQTFKETESNAVLRPLQSFFFSPNVFPTVLQVKGKILWFLKWVEFANFAILKRIL